MKYEYTVERRVLKVASITTLVLGLALLFFSAEIVKLFNKEWSQERHFAVYLGTALLGFAVSNWLYSLSRDLSAVRPAIIGNLVSLVTASVIDVSFLMMQPASPVIWLILLLHMAFVCAFTYCLFNIRRLSKV
jgi:Na+-driven multidrug efflux pump